ncbi:MAG: hypothetical protein OXI63_06635 [Candidatus Poribacteria bacterium]|nr:hypothetical protein [Candidatus Poribacteria bacterium]
MNRKWKADNFKVYYYFVLVALLFIPFGCAMLQEPASVEIFASRLSCEKSPTIVDGDLTTIGSFETDGVIRKGLTRRRYKRQVDGNPKTEMLIKLDAPTYVAYIEVYPASTLRRFALDTAEKRSLKGQLTFTPVEDKRGETVKGTQPVRFQVRRKIRYLRLTAYALEAPENVVHNEDVARELNVLSEIPEVLRQKWEKEKREGKMHIPLKGALIREVKFYGRE